MPSDVEYGPTTPAPRCEEHDGEHARYLGHCLAVGAQVSRPLILGSNSRLCACGGAVYDVIVRRTMRRVVMDYDTGSDHRCSLPPRVEIDEEALADGIAGALHGLMQRRSEQRATRPAVAPAEPVRRQQQPADPDGILTAVAVWESEGAGEVDGDT